MKSRRVRTRNKQNGRVTIAVGGCSNHNAENTPPEPGRTYQYDAENRIKSVGQGMVATYQYDGNGRRAVKNSASGTRIYFFDIEGRPIAESGPTGVWLSGQIYFQNRHVFENTGVQLLWRHPDHLGTAVVRTNSIGEKICDSRFYPYGEEFTPPCAGDPYKFTGKERDAETGLDYFGARHYGSYLGRFVSVDPFLNAGRPWRPQSWNRYAYAFNNPLIFVDPNGLYNLINNCAEGDKKCNKSFQKQSEQLRKGIAELEKKLPKVKDPTQKARLAAALKAFGTENDGNRVNVTFGKLSGSTAAKVDPIFDSSTDSYRAFEVTIDPAKNKSLRDYAINAAHEGTHISDYDAYMLDPDTNMPLSQIEYRGYQTSAWAASALGLRSLSYESEGKTYTIWNRSWGQVDDSVLRSYISSFRDEKGNQTHPEEPFRPIPD